MAEEREMAAKTNELAGGQHMTSATFGLVYSDYEADGGGRGPEDFAKAEPALKKSSKKKK